MIESPPDNRDKPTMFGIDLFRDGDMIKSIDLEYPYWTKVKYKAKALDKDPEELWAALKLKRFVNSRSVELGDSFQYNLPPGLEAQLRELDMQAGGSLQTEGAHPAYNREKLVISTLIEEAFSSSTLEGAISTRVRAKELIISGQKPRTKGETMILNNYRAMEMIRKRRDEDLTLESLLELHGILGRGAMDQGEPGTLRTASQDIDVVDMLTGEVIYTPPLAERLPAFIHELIAFFNHRHQPGARDEVYHHPILRATIVHFMIGYIHPFADGNGRLARGLFYWHMLRNGYWMAEYLSLSQVILKSRTGYYDAYQQVEKDGNDLTYFLLYHTRALSLAVKNLHAYLSRKINEERPDLAVLADTHGISTKQAELYASIRRTRHNWTVRQAEASMAVSHATARTALVALTRAGLLEQFAMDGKTQGWRLRPA